MSTGRTLIAEASQPRLPRGVRLRFDETREQWVLLAPERLFVLDDIALAILRELDGERSVGTIAGVLAARYEAPRDAVLADVVSLLQEFTDKGVIAA
ncbi:MAG TPA: pyrroloquinoline quinone biosynthesis peptide chaperone PqqD [Gammaproteobacteria bacterium]|nr:pyrroloquinoline quinone biosynthesis peptide chaperone PqqD [Gammaproteobacteria bacterium]